MCLVKPYQLVTGKYSLNNAPFSGMFFLMVTLSSSIAAERMDIIFEFRGCNHGKIRFSQMVNFCCCINRRLIGKYISLQLRRSVVVQCLYCEWGRGNDWDGCVVLRFLQELQWSFDLSIKCLVIITESLSPAKYRVICLCLKPMTPSILARSLATQIRH